MEAKRDQGEDEHVGFIHFVLSVFGKGINNVVALVGDNCNVGKSICNKLNRPLIGCASYRFNLAVSDLLSDHNGTIQEVNSLMVKIRTSLLSAKLHARTQLPAKTKDRTSSSVVYSMVKRHDELRYFFHNLDAVAIDELVPGLTAERKINTLLERLMKLVRITKVLQSDKV